MQFGLDGATEFLAVQSLQIAFVFLLAFLLCWILRSASAHWRYLLWLVVIAKCVTPPIVSVPLPVLPMQVVRISAAPVGSSVAPVFASGTTEPTKEDGDAAARGAGGPLRDRTAAVHGVESAMGAGSVRVHPVTLPPIAMMAWMLIASGLLTLLGVRIWTTQRRLRRWRAEVDEESRQALAGLARMLGFWRAPRVYEIESAVQPFVWGWLRGDIYLPREFSKSGSAEERAAILTHELAHVARWDAGVNLLQNIVQAVFFFHPCVWWANWKLRQEREKCCDEFVLSTSKTRPQVYCEAIVDLLARQCAARGATPGLAVTGSARNLKERISTMLAPGRKFFRRPSRVAMVTLLLFAAVTLPTALIVTSRQRDAMAQEQDSAKSKTPVEMKPFKLVLLDDEMKPVAGAKVTAAGLRIKERPSAGCSWPTDVAPKNEFVTNENGVIEMEYPVKFGAPGASGTTTRLIFRVRHADFAGAEVEVDAALGSAEHPLVKGCSAAFRGVHMNGAKTDDFAVHIAAGRGGDPIWKKKKGEASSSGLGEGKWQAMLVSPSADGLHRFSDLLTLDCRPHWDAAFSDIELRPGMRVRGELSQNVPRPVRNGTVNVWCLPKPAKEAYTDEPSLGWAAEAAIADDGTFEFASLPRGGRVQFIALCDGWLVEGVERSLVVGKEITIDEDQLLANRVEGVILPMAPAGSIEVEVVGPEGMPLAGATVASSQNQLMKLSGTTVLGFCYPTIRLVEAEITGVRPPKADFSKMTRYLQKTDENGKAVLREIPLGVSQRLGVVHDHLSMKPETAFGRDPFADHIRFECDSPDVKKLKVQMYRIKESSGAGESPEKDQDLKLDGTMNKPNSGFDISLLTTEEMLKLLKARMVRLSPQTKKAIFDYVDGLQTVPEETTRTVQGLRDGAETISLHLLAPLLQDKGAKAVSTMLTENDDPVMRFAANLLLASQGDAKSIQTMHTLIHDKSLPQIDRRIICSWATGVGIRASDSPTDISEHLASVSRTEPKFKKGDVAPDFELETVSGLKISSKDLRGKVIVLHFWATSCGPCMSDMPFQITSLSEHDPREVEVVFVSLDDERDKFIEAVKKHKIPFKLVRDERGWGGELARQFGVKSLPFDVIIDREGKIASNAIEEIDELFK